MNVLLHEVRFSHRADIITNSRIVKHIQFTLSCCLRFLSSPVTGTWKNADRAENIFVASPGARVGHAWLNFDAIKGSRVPGGEGNGISTGTLGLFIADVEIEGNEIDSPIMPTVRMTTTFWIDRGFYVRSFNIGQVQERMRVLTSTLTQLGGGASATRCRTRSRISYWRDKSSRSREPKT